MFNFLRRNTEEIALLIDIGNGSISGAFVLYVKGQLPKSLYTLRMPFTPTDSPSLSRLESNLFELVDVTLKTMIKIGFSSKSLKNKKKSFSGALITFSSPWFVSNTKHIQATKETPFYISKTFLDDVISKEIIYFEKELAKNLGTESKGLFTIIEKSIVHIKINGYTLEESVNKKSKSFDAFLCMSLVETRVYNKIIDLIIKHTHIAKEKIVMHTFPLVSFSVIRDAFADNSDFVLLDVTGEITDLTLISNDTIMQTVSFPSGRNFILRQIAKTFDIPLELAESNLHMYMENEAGTEIYQKMQTVFSEIEKEWNIYFENALAELSPALSLPYKIYITADSDIAGLVTNFLKSEKSQNASEYRKNINPICINKETLSHLYTSDTAQSVDEFIGILAVFYNKIKGRDF